LRRRHEVHLASKAQLQAIRLQANTLPPGSQRARAFLALLGPIHESWHSTPTVHGFLLFHWEVIRHFRGTGGPTLLGGITPFSLSTFANKYNSPYNVNVQVLAGDDQALSAFSAAVENWHNACHMRISMRDGVDLMNPRTNIFIRQFWRLHYFINARFEEKLRTYSPSTTPVSQIIANFETQNHNFVPSV